MNAEDFARLESALAIRLPDSYRALLCAYPFAADSIAAECLLPNDPSRLLEMNRPLTERGTPPRPSVPHYFMIGSDGGEEQYYLQLGLPESPVYVYDHESHRLEAHAATLDTFVQQCQVSEDEVRRDQQAMARKRGWQFWR